MKRVHTIGDIAKERGVSIEQVLKSAIEENGSILRAAMALKVAPNTLRYWMRKHRLQVEQKTTVSRMQ